MWAWPSLKVICSTHLSIIQSPVQHLLLCGLTQLVSLVLGLGGQVLPLAVQVLQDLLHLIWWRVFVCHQRLARLKRTWYIWYCWLLAHWWVTLCEKVIASLTECPSPWWHIMLCETLTTSLTQCLNYHHGDKVNKTSLTVLCIALLPWWCVNNVKGDSLFNTMP